MSTTGNKIIARSMRLTSLLRSGQTPTTAEYTDGLEALNALLDSMTAAGYLVPALTTDEAMAIPSEANSYTIGSGANFDTDRPVDIKALTIYIGAVPFVIDPAGIERYRAERVASVYIPPFYHYEPTFPSGTLYFPSRLSTDWTISIDSIKPFTAVSDGTAAFSLQPGYEQYLVAQMCMTFGAPEFGGQMTPAIAKMISDSEDFITAEVARNRQSSSRVDLALLTVGRVYNVVSDS